MNFINLVNPVNPVKRCGDLKLSRPGMSLTEILVVIGVMAVLMGVSIPAVKQLMGSFESSTGTRQLINAALSNARAIAVRNQTYAGVRFQEDINGNTYIIFIEHDPSYDPANAPQPIGTGLANGFRAVQGRKPMKLPQDVRIPNGTTVVFSSSGKLTIHDVRVRNKDGKIDSSPVRSNDTIFNITSIVDSGDAMFYQDDYPPMFDEKPSVQSISIGSKKEPTVSKVEYISPYTGELVMEYREQRP